MTGLSRYYKKVRTVTTFSVGLKAQNDADATRQSWISFLKRISNIQFSRKREGKKLNLLNVRKIFIPYWRHAPIFEIKFLLLLHKINCWFTWVYFSYCKVHFNSCYPQRAKWVESKTFHYTKVLPCVHIRVGYLLSVWLSVTSISFPNLKSRVLRLGTQTPHLLLNILQGGLS